MISHEARVQACGICHGDMFTVVGAFPIQYSRVPGHAVVGIIDVVGADVPDWKQGMRRHRLAWRSLRPLRPLQLMSSR